MISIIRFLLPPRPLVQRAALISAVALVGLATPAGAQDNQPFKAGLVSVDYDGSTSTATIEIRVEPDQAFLGGTLTGLQLTLRAPEGDNTQFGDVLSSSFGLQRGTGSNESGVKNGFKYQFYSAGGSGAAEDFLAEQEMTLATVEVEGDKSNVIELAVSSYAGSLNGGVNGTYFLQYSGSSNGTDGQYFHSNNSTPANEFYKTISSGLNPGETTLRPMHQVTVEGTDGTGNADDIGWRLLASPSDATRADLEDDLSFDVDDGFLMYTWSGGDPDAWNPVTNSSGSLPRGQGYILYFFDDNVDPVNAEGLSLDVPDEGEDQTSDFTADGLTQDQKYHLLGNPYDVAFDLGSLAGGDLPGKGFQNTVQVWDPTGIGEWKMITQGETDDNVAAWQGFFIERQETGSGQTSLTFDADGRQSGPGDLIGSPGQPLATATEEQARKTTEELAQVELALTVESNADTVAQDGVTLFLHDEASAGWDAYEASQLPPPNSAVYATVNSPLQRDGNLVRRAQASEPFPAGDATATAPLSVRSVGAAGTATLRWPETARDALPSEWGVQLVDTATGTTVDLRDGSYSFELEDGDGTISDPDDARFDLRVGSSALPVELAGFKAQNTEGTIRLTWQTASETNNAGFYVQRKTRGGSWTRLGFVESKAQGGTTSEPKSYRFRDTGLPYTADSLAYRLRQVDIGGAAHLSDEQVVQRDAPSRVELKPPAPNPAPRRATVWFAVPKATQVHISVYDLLGRRVATAADGRFRAGRHEETIQTASLAPGAYFVRLRTDQKVQTRRLTVVR
jgi:hypothetical protein